MSLGVEIDPLNQLRTGGIFFSCAKGLSNRLFQKLFFVRQMNSALLWRVPASGEGRPEKV